jgi:hypothetical protein
VTCPHCNAALRVDDDVGAGSITCPRCLAHLPNPAAREAAVTGGGVLAISVDDEARRDSRGTGCGVLFLVSLVAVGVAFGLSFGVSALGKAGRYGDNLFIVWFLVGGFGAVLVLGLTMFYVMRALRSDEARQDESRVGRQFMTGCALFLALFAGLLAGLVVLGLTCGAILGGGAVGGGL